MGRSSRRSRFIELNSEGKDKLTEFLATEQDVRLLAKILAREVADWEHYMALIQYRSRENEFEHSYLKERLERVLDFMPELANDINELLGAERLKKGISLRNRSVPENAGCPKCFSPLDRQEAVINNLRYSIHATPEGKWELGEFHGEQFMRFHSFECTDCGEQYLSLHPRNETEVSLWFAAQDKTQEAITKANGE